MEIDEFDRAILREVQVDARQTGDALGAAVGLSATAVQRRLKRLRVTGAIRREVAVLDPAIVGGLMTLMVGITLQRGGAHVVDAFRRTVHAVPEIQQCYYTTGEFDFMLVVIARDMTAYEAFTRRVFFDNPEIAKFHTIVTIEAVKTGGHLPI